MSVELIIHAIECKKSSGSVDTTVIKAVTDSLSKVTGSVGKVVASAGGTVTLLVKAKAKTVAEALSEAGKVLDEIPSLAAAIDKSADLPDQLYLSTSNHPRTDKVWPPDRKYDEISTGPIVRPDLRIPFTEVIDINFWEGDFVTRDDFMGRLTVEASAATGDHIHSQILASEAKGSTYVIAYSVEKTSHRAESA